MDWLDALLQQQGKGSEGQPLYLQIVQALKRAIETGHLAERSKLPTNRELAILLNVDRSTVSRAYAELSEEGLIESHVGRGTFVRPLRQSARAFSSSNVGQDLIEWSEKFSYASQVADDLFNKQPIAAAPHVDCISFAGGIPTAEFYPHEQFEQIVLDLIGAGKAKEMFSYSPVEGHPALIGEVQKHLLTQGIEAADDEILIVSGSQQGIDLITNTFVDPGDAVALEDPSYFWAICNFRSRRADCLALPVEANGINPRRLEKILAHNNVKLLYIMPNFQNPTGASMPLERRLEVVEVCKKYQVPVLEDDFVADLRYEGEQPSPLSVLPGGKDIVIYQSTFSKALCPGLRLGWLVGPAPVIKRLRMAKRTSDLSTNSLAQVVLAEYLRQGLYETHLQRVRLAYRRRRDTMLGALQKYFGNQNLAGHWQLMWTKPAGGLFLWASLPANCSARELLTFAEEEGVTFSLGELFSLNGEHGEFLRLCFIQQEEKQIEEGIRRLAKAVERYLDSVSHRSKLLLAAGRQRRPENLLI